MKYLRTHTGYTLPMILIMSVSILIVITALLAASTTMFSGSFTDHYQKLADEAAEAGTAYATACLANASHSQTWGPAVSKPNLTPQTDCNGSLTFSTNKYVYSDSKVRTYFTVGDLDSSALFSAQVSSTGYTEVLGAGGSVLKTYTSTQKKVLRWPTDVNAQASSSGSRRTCAIVNHQVYCWGMNAYGQLGNGKYLGPPHDIESQALGYDSLRPVKVRQDEGVLAGKKVVKIVVVQFHTCALTDEGKVYCWGRNSSGQLGDGTTIDRPVPVQVSGALAGKVVTDIGGTGNATCAISGGKIYCWGTNWMALTGRNTTSGSTLSPTLVSATNTSTTLPTNYTATALATSGSRSAVMCAIANSKAYCWGRNTVGSVGDNSTTDRTVPTKVYDGGVLSGKTVTAISQDGYISPETGGYTHVCALASGKVYCWGENNYGQLGNNSTTDSRVPVAVVSTGVLNGKTIQDIKVGLNHSCVLADGGVYCWGIGASGQVGDNASSDRRVPVAVATDPNALTSSNVVTLGAGSNRGCAVITDGRTFCWGYNADGQIGDGTTINRRIPTESLFLRPVGNQFIF